MARKLTEEKAAEHGIGPAGSKHNGFPTHAEIQMAVNEQLAWNLQRKALNDKISTFRKGLRAKGITLGTLDDKVRKLEWTPEEVKKDHDEQAWYAEAMRFPVGTQLELYGTDATPDPVREQLRWKNIGHKDGLAGRGWSNEPPDGCPPECAQSYGEGHEEGQELVRRAFLDRKKGLQPLAPAKPGEDADDDAGDKLAAETAGETVVEAEAEAEVEAGPVVVDPQPAADQDWQAPTEAEAALEEA